ncbi:helix-turn-helix transcriptional regulator [Flagellimonas hymeniacidonis]|uniref:Helix-turn-helix transcriptional regulator n=1 Tax=Flagellimonas hymeniacidonis TaxID=2603628 RepID=A0A5C8V449_9FLAO|nr:helix-turn-helix transcriptional regulator [Flagellimonas hymeniacidonis]TXN36131.1 helix-turn-helix transcriptional regulator [Flagellimonas hymeniacidonis]
MKKVGLRIRQLRKEKQLSQFQLSIEADLTKNQIGRIERAERNTSLVTLNRIAGALEVPLHTLFLFEE